MSLSISDVNPEMVTLARKSRRKTQVQLAKDAGVTQSKISKCEAGVLPVDEQILEQLSRALDYPPQFFSQQTAIEGPGISELFHRKRSRVGVGILNQAYALAEVRRQEVNKLIEAHTESVSKAPFLPIDEFDEDATQIARTVRAYWQISPGPMFNVTKDLERHGCLVVAHSFGTRLLDGFSCRSLGMPPIFHLNRTLPPDRWRWTLAHELGHVVMHSEPGRPSKLMERQADQFAGEFLAPERDLKPMLWNLDFERLAALKREWKISMQALLMRAFHLGAISDGKRRRMFMELSKAGYRLREPEALDPPIEVPASLFNLARFHMTKLEFTRDELKTFLAIGEQDLHTYYHDPHDVLHQTIGVSC